MGQKSDKWALASSLIVFSLMILPPVNGYSLPPTKNTEGLNSTFLVTKTQDTADGLCDDDCSLREAVIAANSSPGTDTILVPEGTYVLSIAGSNEDAARAGDLDITDSLILYGAGLTMTIIDGGEVDRVFHVDPAGSGILVNMSDVTIQNGWAADTPNTFDSGGGIDNHGQLILYNVKIDGNRAPYFGNGGGLYNAGTAMLSRVTVSNNDAYLSGGIGNDGTLRLVHSTVNGNASIGPLGSGGGLHNAGDTDILTTSVSNNTARVGGGISNSGSGHLKLTYCTVSGNTASFTIGGGIFNEGIFEMTNSTISSNSAATDGGGIFHRNIAALANVTIAGNQAKNGHGGGLYNEGEIQIENTLLADSLASGVLSNCYTPGSGSFTDFGYNGEDANTCGFSGPGNIVNANLLIGPLQPNGGSTLTHALLEDSPAIDAGNPNSCTDIDGVTVLPTDQRGFSRPVDGNNDGNVVCDMGAYEFGSDLPPAVDLEVLQSDAPDPVSVGDVLTYTVVVTNKGEGPATDIVITDTLPTSVTYAAFYATDMTCRELSGVVTCKTDYLGKGDAASCAIFVYPGKVGILENVVNATSSENDTDETNNSALSSTIVKSRCVEGDVNCDGIVNLADAVLSLQVVAAVLPDANVSGWGDVGLDGAVGLAEVVYVLQKVAGLRM